MADVASCPGCGTSIDDRHDHSWCIKCGEPLPSEIQMRLPTVASRAGARQSSDTSDHNSAPGVMSDARSATLGTPAAIPPQPGSLPGSVKAFGYSYIGLGVMAAFAGIAGIGSGNANMRLFFVIVGGVLVVTYGVMILTRSRLALGRWWFLAAWCMNLLSPLGLVSLALIIWSTLVLRWKHAGLFAARAAS